jgi:hypothetical protein
MFSESRRWTIHVKAANSATSLQHFVICWLEVFVKWWKYSGLYWVLDESDHLPWLPWWVQASVWQVLTPVEFRCLVRQNRQARVLRSKSISGPICRRISKIAGQIFFRFLGPLSAPHVDMTQHHEEAVCDVPQCPIKSKRLHPLVQPKSTEEERLVLDSLGRVANGGQSVR